MRARWMMLATLLGLSVSSLSAHEIHRSKAEAEFNVETHQLEVSLTVFVSDLEVALVRQAEREISFKSTPAAEIDAQIQRYLRKEFAVADESGAASKIEWVGREFEAASQASGDPEVTLYFQFHLPQGLRGVTLRYAVFVDRFKDQLNLLHLRSDNRSVELSFTREAVVKALRVGS